MKGSWMNLICGVIMGICNLILFVIIEMDIPWAIAFANINMFLYAIFLQLADLKNKK